MGKGLRGAFWFATESLWNLINGKGASENHPLTEEGKGRDLRDAQGLTALVDLAPAATGLWKASLCEEA